MKSLQFKHFNLSFKILRTPSEACQLFLSIHKTNINILERNVSKYNHVNGSSWEAPDCIDFPGLISISIHWVSIEQMQTLASVLKVACKDFQSHSFCFWDLLQAWIFLKSHIYVFFSKCLSKCSILFKLSSPKWKLLLKWCIAF